MAKTKKSENAEIILEQVEKTNNNEAQTKAEVSVNTYDQPKEKYSWLFYLLSFILFPVGIILYFVFRNTHKDWAGACSKGAMWGVCFIITAAFVTLIILFILFYANGCAEVPFMRL